MKSCNIILSFQFNNMKTYVCSVKVNVEIIKFLLAWLLGILSRSPDFTGIVSGLDLLMNFELPSISYNRGPSFILLKGVAAIEFLSISICRQYSDRFRFV